MRPQDRDHDAAVRYLLGEMTEQECDALEEAYFAREGGFEELEAIEHELIDSYVAGELSPAQRQRFESRYPAKEHGDGIDFARALKETLRDRRPVSAGGRVPRRQPWLPWLWPAAALLILGTAWLGRDAWPRRMTLPSPGTERSVEPPRDLASPPTEPSPSAAEGSRGPSPGSSPATSGSASPASGTTLQVTLAPGQVRDGGGMTTVVVAADVERIALTLLLEDGKCTRCQAVIERPAGEDQFSSGPLRAYAGRQGLAVDVTVPARRLPAGDYVVVLKSPDRSGRLEDRADYAFRVARVK